MKICETGLNFFQVNNDQGDVRICAWTTDCFVGNLTKQTFEEIWGGDRANALRTRLIGQDYSKCIIDNCPYLSRNEIEEHMVEIDEIPDYPECLSLSYDNICNYNCATCDIHERYQAADKEKMEERFEKIESEIRKILPHIKEISANGQGEVFASERTMKLLSEWKPLAPASECRVSLETNGSLFDESHWKKIENLGNYNLWVSVTVMSFDEYTYQQLSGVKYPISRIENNLRFIKSLREKGIINFLELATVVQERNFRQLPEFTRRCIEEFGADSVRLRYFLPWNKKAPEIEWFADVRNPYHPYYEEYREIMRAPIFRHPKVDDWSGGRDSLLGEHPFKKRLNRSEIKIRILDFWISNQDEFMMQLKKYIPEGSSVIIYGIGELGRLMVNAMKEIYSIKIILDRSSYLKEYEGYPVCTPSDFEDDDKKDYLIITPVCDTAHITKDLIDDCISKCHIIDIETIFLK